MVPRSLIFSMIVGIYLDVGPLIVVKVLAALKDSNCVIVDSKVCANWRRICVILVAHSRDCLTVGVVLVFGDVECVAGIQLASIYWCC